jgi:transcriptional regulator with XRE-family HTH domain
MRLRQKLIEERERLDLTQEQVALKAGVRQGLVSRWEDLSVTMTDPSARVLFQIIERAFGKSLTAFFAEIEGVTHGAKPATPASESHADSLPTASTTIGPADLERFARTIARSIGREMRPQTAHRRTAKAPARRARRR